MTDNEIKKALECCAKGFGNCNGCPYDDDNEDCVTLKGETLMMKDALDLINRLQAEIERLQKENVELGKAISNEYELNKFLEATRKCVREEAVKEFWDKVVEKYESVNGQYVDRVMLGIAKDLVNEMTEQ